jgi:hypothetical protein
MVAPAYIHMLCQISYIALRHHCDVKYHASRPYYYDKYRTLHLYNIAHLRRGAIHYARPISQDIIPNTKKAGLINQPPTDDGTGLHSHTGMNTAPYVPIISCIDSHNIAHLRRGAIHYARPISQDIIPNTKKAGLINQPPTDDGTSLHSHTGMNTAPYVPIISCIDSHNIAHLRRGVIHYARPISQEYPFRHKKLRINQKHDTFKLVL